MTDGEGAISDIMLIKLKGVDTIKIFIESKISFG
jgi:hypothetical protein